MTTDAIARDLKNEPDKTLFMLNGASASRLLRLIRELLRPGCFRSVRYKVLKLTAQAAL